MTDPHTEESKTVYDSETGYLSAEIDPECRATRYAHYPADHPSAGRFATVADAAGKTRHIACTEAGQLKERPPRLRRRGQGGRWSRLRFRRLET